MLERSAEAKAAKSVFYEELNDVDIYIEDTGEGLEKLYKEILNRVFVGKYHIYKVFALGTRNNVINECSKNQGTVSRPSLYIIDGDLYLLNNDDPIDKLGLRGLFRLPYYCIENLLIDPDAIHCILNEEDHKRDLEELEPLMDYENWNRKQGNLLYRLFIEYAVSKKLTPHLPTISLGVKGLVAEPGILDETRVASRIESVKEQVIALVGKESYESEKNLIISRAKESGFPTIRYVSGKDYLLPLLLARIRNIVFTKATNISLKVRLAMKCDISDIQNCCSYVME